jgi:translation initiation factor IF-3
VEKRLTKFYLLVHLKLTDTQKKMVTQIKKNNVEINEAISCKSVRCVYDGDTKIIDTYVALNIAKNVGLDLVIVSPEADPPVAKILDYNKLKFTKKKAQKEHKQKKQVTKELKLSANIADHDLNTKLRAAKKFIKKSYKVKFKLSLRGRESVQVGFTVIKKVRNLLKDVVSDTDLQKTENAIILIVS